MKKATIVFMGLLLIAISSCRKTSSDHPVTMCLQVELATGTQKDIKVTVPNYADLAIYESRGGYRLSTWEYIGWTKMKSERTIKNGVIDFKVIDCK